MGGMIATRYVQRYGEEVRALVLSGPLLGDRTAISDLAELPTIPDAPLDTATRRAIRRLARPIRKIRWCGTGRSSAPPCAPCSGSSPPSTPGRASARYPRWIHGDDDRLVLMSETQTALDRLRGDDFERMINAGGRHESFNETNKDQILKRVTDFIARALG